MTDDRIERSVDIAASQERVWQILTTPEYIGRWFGDGTPAVVDLQAGGVMELEPGKGERYLTRIEKVDPPNYLSYRWAAAHAGVLATDTNSTLVEFRLESTGATTRLTVCESGFATLTIPPGREEFAGIASHTRGWPEVLVNLAKQAEGTS